MTKKEHALERISKVVDAAAAVSDLLGDMIDEAEKVIGNELADLLRSESSEITTCLNLMGSALEELEKSKSIFPVLPEGDSENFIKIN